MPKNVKKSDLAPSSVNSSKIADGGVDAPDVANGAVGASQIASGAVGAAEIGPDSVGSESVLDDALTGADVRESTLSGLEADADLRVLCDPTSTTFLGCGDPAEITVARETEALVIVTAQSHSEAGGAAAGRCQIQRDGLIPVNSYPVGELTDNTSTSARQIGMSYASLLFLDPGTHAFELACNETDADIQFSNIHVVAVALSPG